MTASNQRVVPACRSRSAITLVEMLVVISILVLLAAMTIPNVRPALENRRLRETARSIEAYLNRARVDAIERGTAVGVQFVRAPRQNEACIQLQQVLSPSVYTGESTTAVVRVQRWGSTTPVVVKILVPSDAIGQQLLRRGDLIQFNTQAWSSADPTYYIFDDTGTPNPPTYLPDFPLDSSNFIDFKPTGATTVDYPDPPTSDEPIKRSWITNYVLTAVLINQGVSVTWPTATAAGDGNKFPPPATPENWSLPQSFAVLRQPVASSVAPLQLPESLCVDLYESGTNGVNFYPFNEYSPSVTVMFSPSGTLKQVYGSVGILPTDRLYFLVGRRDRLPVNVSYPTGTDPFPARGDVPHEDGRRNWEDLNNLWVSIIPRSGMTVTIENSAYPQYGGADYAKMSTAADRLDAVLKDLRGARVLAETAQNMGGR